MNLIRLVFDFLLISLAGLFIAFSPMLIITDLLIVLKSKRPVLHAAVLLASIAAPLLLLALIASQLMGPDTSIDIAKLHARLSVPPLVLLLVGLILLWFGAQRFLKLKYRPLQAQPAAKADKQPPSRLVPLFMFGFTKTLFSLTNVAAILFVTKLIVSSKLNPLLALLVVFWTIVVGLVPFFVIFYYQKNRREYLLRLQAVIDARMSTNVKAYGFAGLAILGGLLCCNGLYQLVSRW